MQPVLFLVGSSKFRELGAVIAEIAHPHAIDNRDVYVSSVPEAKTLARREVVREALETQRRLGGKEPTVIVDKRLKLDRCDILNALAFQPEHLKFAHVQVLLAPDNKQRSNETRRLLRLYGLDTFGYACECLRTWKHGNISSDHVAAWMAQFAAVGATQALAEKLLKQLRILPPHDLFSSAKNFIHKDDTIVVLQDPEYPGKSAAEVANILSARFRSNPMKTLNAAIEEGEGKTIHVFEDGAWTATEIVAIVHSLLGLRGSLRQKVPKLKDPKILNKCTVHFHFHVTTDIARRVFDDMKRELALADIHMAPSPLELVTMCKKQIDNLPPKWYSLSVWPAGIVEPQFIENGVGDINVRETELIRHIGRQLWKNYLQDQVDGPRKWTMWDDQRISESALGMRGLGVMTAFSHSAPKAMLPLFWGYGRVTSKAGRATDWIPLLPNAA